jgi:hypothetical protein
MSAADQAGERAQERPSPYDMVFGHELFGDRYFPAIAEEAAERGIDTWHPERFAQLKEVVGLLRRLMPAELAADGSDGLAAGFAAQYVRLLYQAFHFWLADCPHYEIGEERLRAMLEAGAVTAAPPPVRAGYVRLPRHLVWGRTEAGAAAEPVDGFFWTSTAARSAALEAGRLDVLLALGVRAGRGGFSIVDAGLDLEEHPAHAWQGVNVREAGRDFENILPGGELDGLYGVVSAGEALKLAAGCFALLEPGKATEPHHG